MFKLLRIFSAGFVATRLMSDVMYKVAPKLGLTRVDVAGTLGSAGKKSDEVEDNSSGWNLGMVAHYLLGTILFPLTYETTLRKVIPGKGLAKDIVWALGLWFVGQSAVLPSFGKGPFLNRRPDAKLTYLLAHLIYGITYGSVKRTLLTRNGR